MDSKKLSDSPQTKLTQKKMKKLSSKEIYRILAFQYRAGPNGLKYSLLADIVANLFYPYDPQGDAKKRFKTSLEGIFKGYSIKDEVSEENFCQALDSVEKYMTDENTESFLKKIFKRHDKDKDGYLNKEEFKILIKNYKDETLGMKEIEDLYTTICADQNEKLGIDLKSFIKYCSNNMA